MSEVLLATLKNQSIPVTPHYLVKTKEAVEPNQPARAQLRYVSFSLSLLCVFCSSYLYSSLGERERGWELMYSNSRSRKMQTPDDHGHREERIPNLAEPETSATTTTTTPSYHHFEELRLMHELKESVCEVVTPAWDDKCVSLSFFLSVPPLVMGVHGIKDK